MSLIFVCLITISFSERSLQFVQFQVYSDVYAPSRSLCVCVGAFPLPLTLLTYTLFGIHTLRVHYEHAAANLN